MKKLLVALCLVVAVAAHAKVYLVSVGIADYPGVRNDLRVSDNDAKTIANVYRATKDAEVTVLTNHQVTKQAVLDAMETAFAQAKSDDAVILYFSGHGVPGALACYDGLLPYQPVTKILKESKANTKVIIADACYSGKMRNSKEKSGSYSKKDIMFFLSSRTGERSLESPYQNSLFTIFLERGLRGGADADKDRHVTARELFDFVHNGVAGASNDMQHPVMWGKFDDDMTIINW